MVDIRGDGTPTTFLKVGRENGTAVTIGNERKIGSGRYGTAYEADVSIGGHTRRFIIKRFHEQSVSGNSHPPEEIALDALKNYELAKKAGLKVFPTYRLGEDGKSILMTSGNTQANVCLGTNFDSPSVKSLFGESIQDIPEENLNKFMERAFQQAILADAKGIVLYADAFFFFVDRATRTKLDFVIGDLDNVAKHLGTPDALTRVNLRNVRYALDHFSVKNVSNLGSYQKALEDTYDSFVYHQGLTNV